MYTYMPNDYAVADLINRELEAGHRVIVNDFPVNDGASWEEPRFSGDRGYTVVTINGIDCMVMSEYVTVESED